MSNRILLRVASDNQAVVNSVRQAHDRDTTVDHQNFKALSILNPEEPNICLYEHLVDMPTFTAAKCNLKLNEVTRVHNSNPSTMPTRKLR